jgi:hypothetical protein
MESCLHGAPRGGDLALVVRRMIAELVDEELLPCSMAVSVRSRAE